MSLTILLVDDSPLPADFHGLAAVALVRRHELVATVAVSVVVPIHERGDPQAGFLNARESGLGSPSTGPWASATWNPISC
jgi:hypothetical protein